MTKRDASLTGIAGVDEAGRGPMIGPMIICGVLVDADRMHELEALNVRDSKLLSPKQREKLSEKIMKIAKKIAIREISASDIDSLRKHTTLNEIEVSEFVSIVKTLKPEKVYLDAADVKADRFGSKIGKISGLAAKGTIIVSEHKADSKYPIVSAASILAKVERDRIITNLHQKYGDFGSGYPSDPKTVDFVRNLVRTGKKLPSIVRHSWDSVRRIIDEESTEQTRLE
ncbi:MAG: ribonuclease HII [Candidatus Thorarchaeota archaeon]|nr:ribonuclease HII [Candidatus Thorarchaeota archaeon]